MSQFTPTLRAALRLTSVTRTTLPASRPRAPAAAAAALSTSRTLRLPYKDDQDRESLKPKANEYAKSGTDDDAAANEDAAFNPNKTSPEDAKDTASGGNEGNPLEFSGANKGVADAGQGKEEDRTKGGNEKNRKASGGGDSAKAGKL